MVGVMLLLGELVPRFDLVMSLFGAALTGPLMFVLPPILFIIFKQKLHERKINGKLRIINLMKIYAERLDVRKSHYGSIKNEQYVSFNEILNLKLEEDLENSEERSTLIFNTLKCFYSEKDLDKILDEEINILEIKIKNNVTDNRDINDKSINPELEFLLNDRNYFTEQNERIVLKNELRNQVLNLNNNTFFNFNLKIWIANFLKDLFYFTNCLNGNNLSFKEKCINVLLVVLSIFATVFATYFSIKSVIVYSHFVPSCIMNATAATLALNI